MIPPWGWGQLKLKFLTLQRWNRESAELKLRCLQLRWLRRSHSMKITSQRRLDEVVSSVEKSANWNQLLLLLKWNVTSGWNIVAVVALKVARRTNRYRKQTARKEKVCFFLILIVAFLVPSTGRDLQKPAEQSRNVIGKFQHQHHKWEVSVEDHKTGTKELITQIP